MCPRRSRLQAHRVLLPRRASVVVLIQPRQKRGGVRDREKGAEAGGRWQTKKACILSGSYCVERLTVRAAGNQQAPGVRAHCYLFSPPPPGGPPSVEQCGQHDGVASEGTASSLLCAREKRAKDDSVATDRSRQRGLLASTPTCAMLSIA